MSRPHTRGSLYRDIYSAAITCGLDFRPKYWHEQTRRTRASPCFGGHFPWSVTFVCSQTLVYAFTFLPACLYLHALDWKMKFFFFIAHAVHLSSVAIKWWNISWKHNPLKRLRWLFLKEWKVLIQRSHELTEGCGDGEYQMEASPTSSPAPSSSSFSSSSSKLKYRLNCRGKEDLFLFKPIGPVPLLCKITLLIRSLPPVLLLKPSVFGTAPKDTVLRRGFTGAARQTTGILKAQSKLTTQGWKNF